MEKVCCGCQRIKRRRGWVKMGKKLAQIKASHGYCPECYRKALQKVMDFGAHFHPVVE